MRRDTRSRNATLTLTLTLALTITLALTLTLTLTSSTRCASTTRSCRGSSLRQSARATARSAQVARVKVTVRVS